ncbi:XRN 5'-3' exonuclease [Oesophagostomum dentatum]|uniref:XRN 5'-3' exonuclease n=1 Tax=Oesophagostomum dentatum TaxID=61180 RepID=A0A0B1TLD6_OESDE|nr:XRN 5'-3' exonuclease [Oesophagostomum dentatum]
MIPEFDNLYLDMNGIIHNCSHPNDDDFSFRISQEQIFADIFAYIDKLFNIIRPKKVFFLAVDGVAPRAKMNQQRARRFMSARTAEEQLQAHIRKGEELPKEKRFDSNCITPESPKMGVPKFYRWISERYPCLSEVISDTEIPEFDNLYLDMNGIIHNCSHPNDDDFSFRISQEQIFADIFAYIDCPGEGEHKIMDFIRHERTADGYDPNTRHCMYGLDADLLMLGMCSHEPHFSLLREEVKFNRPPSKKSTTTSHRVNPSQINFHLLHLSLLREYLAWEFHPLRTTLPFPFDVERIIDDWVLMGFLVGNDFIPHLPHVHIHDDALPLLYQTYIQVLPTLEGYINESGILNLQRFEVFLKAFAANDRRCFLQTLEDESWLRSKTGRDPHGVFEKEKSFEEMELSDTELSEDTGESADVSPDDEAAFVSSDEEESEGNDANEKLPDGGVESAAELLSRLNAEPDNDEEEDELCDPIMAAELREMDDKVFENDVENCWTKTVSNSFRRHKRLYYREKMKYANITKSELREQAEGYVRAIQWNLHYYYKGCVSWNWFYPHHYSPYISDVVDFSNMDMSFELGEPFKPFEQLLAVLPAASAECLPKPFRDLMCNKESPIADFYPTDFKTDLNGKKNDWEAVVLIPFIEEARLLDAVKSKMPLLTPEENARNSVGDVLLYKFDAKIPQVKSKLPVDAFHLDPEQVIWGLLQDVKLDVYFPGFPTMKHLPHSAELKEVNVKVFQQESKRSSMVLTINKRPEFEKDALELAKEYIGKEVCIDWPILKMGLVDSFWAGGNKYSRDEAGEVTAIALDEEEKEVMKSMLYVQKDRLLTRYAIDVKTADVIVFVRHFAGLSYAVENGVLHPHKQWAGSHAVVPVLLPLLVTNVSVDSGVGLRDIPVVEAYPKHSKVVAIYFIC